jgi:hypothetical protein
MGKTFSTGLLTNGIWQDASNNIGIGGSPSGSYKFEVTGTGRISGTLLVSGAVTLGTGTSAYTFGGGSATAGNLTDKDLTLKAWSPSSGTNEYGGDLILAAGVGTGNTSGKLGNVIVRVGTEGATSSTLGTLSTIATFTKTGLGIGTSSPNGKLHIEGSGNVFTRTKSTSSDGVSAFIASNDLNQACEIGIWGSTRTGFGVIQPPDGYIYSGTDLAISSATNIKFGTGASNTEIMRITSAGNIGIGTTSPSAKLDVRGASIYLNISDTSDSRYVNIGNWVAGKSTIETGGGDLFIKTQTSNYLALGTANAERIRITSDGIFQIVNSSYYRNALQPSNFGYNGVYRTLIVGSSSTDYTTGGVTLAFNVDVSGNVSGAFTGNGSEYIFRNTGSFITPNSSNNGYNTLIGWNTNGVVTKPSNPAFRAYYSVNSTWTLSGGAIFNFNATEYNIGSCYNTSNGRFTAPVAGVYQFNFYTIVLGNYANASISFRKNGGALTSGYNVHFSPYYTSSMWSNVVYTTSLYLNANDYVHMINNGGTTDFHGDDWSSFSGFLVG